VGPAPSPPAAPRPAKRRRRAADIEVVESASPLLFVEVCAGDAGLTQAVSEAGVQVLPPNEFTKGGTDLTCEEAVESLKEDLMEQHQRGHLIVLHIAPPCSTFSRARDRSRRTQLRSARFPSGLPFLLHPRSRRREAILTANKIAYEAFALAAWAHGTLRAVVSIENPDRSYIWAHIDSSDLELGDFSERVLSQCRYGAAYQKNTRLRVWGSGLPGLDLRCRRSGTHFSCGRKVSDGHVVLGFGGADTAAAAAYPEGLCTAWASAIAELAAAPSAEARVRTVASGPVRRHIDRGEDPASKAETRQAEDHASRAGMRNAALVVENWPQLGAAMAPVFTALKTFHDSTPEARGLWRACGRSAPRPPPAEATVTAARKAVATALHLTYNEAEAHHDAASWRYNIVRRVGSLAEDPDVHIGDWLEHGAPAGMALDIEPGHLLPAVAADSTLSVDDLEALSRIESNHPSFFDLHGEKTAPGIAIIQAYVDKGFGHLFADQDAAEAYLGCKVFPAPLGNITKTRQDGSLKHRVIQDLRANSVNRVVRLPERQVLPRPIDHGRDLADLAALGRTSTLVMDFEDAFMGVPIRAEEQRFCCATVPQGIRRSRAPISNDEPREGTFVVWRVLGFGGRSFPVVFSRPASFAARTAQALFWSPTDQAWRPREASARLQMYVDDPIITLASHRRSRRTRAADIILMWWLVLGVALSWAKGRWADEDSDHEWIGVTFSLSDGTAVMSLPPQFVAELKALLAPLAAGSGHIRQQEVQTIIGKCGRVAHIVPEARPFVGALFAAQAGARLAQESGRREAPPGRLPAKRFAVAARWMLQVLSDDSAPFPLERRVLPGGPSRIPLSGWIAQFDASPWGGGAVLRNGSTVTEFWMCKWEQADVAHLPVRVGEPSAQTFLEMLALLISLVLWADYFVAESLQVVGDNTGALSSALQLKGSGPLLAIAREIAWRQARRRWAWVAGHIPSEENVVPDALSRQAGPQPPSFPSRELAGARRRACPSVPSLWKV